MIRLIFLSFFIFFLCGCANSNSVNIGISPINKDLSSFRAGSCNANATLRYLGSFGDSSRLVLQRDFYENGGNVGVYERGRLHHNLEFSVSADSVVNFAFELQNAKITSLDNFHSYIEGISKISGKQVYIIAASVGAFDGFDLFYSDNKDLIAKFASCIKNGNFEETQMSEPQDNSILPLRSYVRSDFGPALFIKYDIIKSKNDGRRFLR